jgi:glycopeptide antibiotics resistance protein
LRLFLGNIGSFVPLGFLLPILLKRKSLIITVAIGFTFSFLIESAQYISYKGIAEVDDLILNTLGAAMGYFSFFVAAMVFGRDQGDHVSWTTATR